MFLKAEKNVKCVFSNSRYRNTLGICWWYKISNDTVRQTVNRKETITDTIQQRHGNWGGPRVK